MDFFFLIFIFILSYFLSFFFYCYAITVVCLFSPSLYPNYVKELFYSDFERKIFYKKDGNGV